MLELLIFILILLAFYPIKWLLTGSVRMKIPEEGLRLSHNVISAIAFSFVVVYLYLVDVRGMGFAEIKWLFMVYIALFYGFESAVAWKYGRDFKEVLPYWIVIVLGTAYFYLYI